jgi:hypothetical protein
MRSYGRLEIISNACIITIDDVAGFRTGPVPLGIIKYTSANAYYIPEEKQSYVYEAGSIITSQTKGSSISIKPSFKLVEIPENKIVFSVVNISGVGDKTSIGGYDTIPIQTEFFINTSNSFPTITNSRNLTIETYYPMAWYVFLNSSLKLGGYEYGYTNDYIIDYTDDKVVIEFRPNSGYPDIELALIDIFGQIGPGWVE